MKLILNLSLVYVAEEKFARAKGMISLIAVRAISLSAFRSTKN